jgi:hypothetical protein
MTVVGMAGGGYGVGDGDMPEWPCPSTAYTSEESAMSSISVRISRVAHERLRKLGEDRHTAIGEVVTEFLDAYERETFWQNHEQTSAAAQANPALRRAMREEQREFDGSLMDGLEDVPWSDE